MAASAYCQSSNNIRYLVTANVVIWLHTLTQRFAWSAAAALRVALSIFHLVGGQLWFKKFFGSSIYWFMNLNRKYFNIKNLIAFYILSLWNYLPNISCDSECLPFHDGAASFILGKTFSEIFFGMWTKVSNTVAVAVADADSIVCHPFGHRYALLCDKIYEHITFVNRLNFHDCQSIENNSKSGDTN